MPLVIDGEQQTADRKRQEPAIKTSTIMRGKPGIPRIVKLLGVAGLAGGAGQLASQSTQLQAGISFCSNKKNKVTSILPLKIQ